MVQLRALFPLATLWLTISPLATANHHLLRFPLLPMAAWEVQQSHVSSLNLSSSSVYIPYTFPQLTDHFSSLNTTFSQRYWIDTTYYHPGGPIILLDGGETSGEDRLEFLRTGIVHYLMEQTNGIGIILEHRYYGKSHVSNDLTLEGLKYLDTAQSLADNAYFAENLYKHLPETLGGELLHPNKTAWISYGGSYAGAKSAFLRKVYPDVFWGAIASSAVVWAGENFWEYNEPVRIHGDPACVGVWQEVVRRVDELSEAGTDEWVKFKGLFGVDGGVSDEDFANFVGSALGFWQGGNWDRSLPGATTWDAYCTVLTADLTARTGGAQEVLQQMTESQGVRNFASQSKRFLDACKSRGYSASDCLSTDDPRPYKRTGLEQEWRLWIYQVCTEWGYFMPAAPSGHPSMLPQLLTLDYTRKICQYAFDFPEDKRVNATKVLQYGGFNLTADRLMYIDGAYDPWLYATVHSPYSPQNSTVDENQYGGILIAKAWHHNDENGLGKIEFEPKRIREVHRREIEAVERWLEQWTYHKRWEAERGS